MKALLNQEFKKIFSYRFNKIAILLLFFWILFICISAMQQESIIVDMNSPRLLGKEAIKIQQQEFTKNKGYLTNEKINEYIGLIQDEAGSQNVSLEKARDILVSENFISVQEITTMINQVLSSNIEVDNSLEIFKVDTPIDFYKSWENKALNNNAEIGSVNSNTTPFYYDYSKGWQTILNKSVDLMLGILIVLAICLSNTFTEDIEQGVDSIVLSSKFGRKHYLSAKIRSSVLMSTSLYLISVALFTFIMFFEFGTTGSNVSIQIKSSLFYTGEMNYLSASIITFALGYIAIIFMTFIALFLSTILKSSFKVSIISILICLIPFVFISFSEPNTLISCLFPIALIDKANIFQVNQINFGIMSLSKTWVNCIIILIFILVMYIFIRIASNKFKER